MQIDLQRLKLMIGEQAMTLVAMGAEIEALTKERDELKEKLEKYEKPEGKPVAPTRPKAVEG